jgi:hypothetical protein
MRVDIKEGGDGFACWNAAAIRAFAESADAREAQLAAANPDLVVTPGRVKCYGCQVNDFDLGIRCTAELTRTLYAVAGEVAPRAADAGGSLADIPGLRSRVEKTQAAPQAAAVAPAAPAAPRSEGFGAPVPPVPPVPADRRSGLSRLLGRRG